jgi:hypothetical protein
LGIIDESELDGLKDVKFVDLTEPHPANENNAQIADQSATAQNDSKQIEHSQSNSIDYLADITNAATLGALEIRYRKALALNPNNDEVCNHLTQAYENRKSELGANKQ